MHFSSSVFKQLLKLNWGSYEAKQEHADFYQNFFIH